MISVTELRAGIVFEDQGNTYQVISYEHIKMGRGSATIKVKIKNIKSGAITEKGFINGVRVKDLQVLKKQLQFLYKDNDFLYFMNPQTFEQINIILNKISEHAFFKEGETYQVNFLDNEVLSVNLPPKVDLRVVDTGSSIRGNSATNIYKDAVLENGVKTKVPLFIKIDDIIRLDTRTGTYSEKA